jgi:hypothetical protein
MFDLLGRDGLIGRDTNIHDVHAMEVVTWEDVVTAVLGG